MSRNGSGSPDTRDEGRTIVPRIEVPAGETQESAAAKKTRRGGRRASNETDNVRYFVGRAADGDSKPMLEQEVASEPEALVIAFKNDSRVYFITEYRVTERIEGSQVRLEKEQVAPVQRVSTLNAS